MKILCMLSSLVLSFIILSSFTPNDESSSEYIRLQKLEHRALKKNVIKSYVFDLTHNKGCNKTRIKYLGIVRTNKGNRYKVLTSFFVFSTSAGGCHGTSRIKIYDMKNRFVGEYNVGMPESLPDALRNNKLRYLNNSEECSLRKTRVINLSKGLPKTFFIPCSKNGGDMYSFSDGD